MFPRLFVLMSHIRELPAASVKLTVPFPCTVHGLYVLVARMCPAETAEPIEMPFRPLTRVGSN